jgi:nicotinate phosphoribosyltransferase
MGPDVSQRWARRENLALLTDFYQLTMMGGYWKIGRKDLTACFNYSFRDLPPHNGFAVAAGLEQLLDLVEGLRFTEQDLDYLSGLGAFDGAFIDYLRDFARAARSRPCPRERSSSPMSPFCRSKAR